MSAIDKASPSLLAEIDFGDLLEWLKQQPDSREFFFYNGLPKHEKGCLLCEYLKSKDQKDFRIGGYSYDLNGENDIKIPESLRIQMGRVEDVFTAKDAKNLLSNTLSTLREAEGK